MRYAGFWPRLGALLVDAIVIGIPLVSIFFWAAGWGSKTALASVTASMTILGAIYYIYFTGRWGQTLGKMAMEIRVTKIDGARVTMREGFLRHMVDLVLAILASLGMLVALYSISLVDFESKGLFDRIKLLQSTEPPWARWNHTAQNLWVWSELVVLLLNKKRRALHDFIAGTVVVHVEKRVSAI